MDKHILVAGATGNLGERICRELLKTQTQVRAVVRKGTKPEKIKKLKDLGVEVLEADLSSQQELSNLLTGTSCVISALAGLSDVIVDVQLNLLKAAITAGVPRFIPSDFCTDYTNIPEGENRNFDLRKKFQAQLDHSAIQATSIFNGAFADILHYNTPLFNVPEKTIAYFEGKADWKIDFTTMDDTAAYTAAVALDENSPRFLNIASFSISAQDLAAMSTQFQHEPFTMVNMGTLEALSKRNKQDRMADPEGEKELYPRWQQAQYLHSMFFAHHNHLDNDRYKDLKWASATEIIQQSLKTTSHG